MSYAVSIAAVIILFVNGCNVSDGSATTATHANDSAQTSSVSSFVSSSSSSSADSGGNVYETGNDQLTPPLDLLGLR